MIRAASAGLNCIECARSNGPAALFERHGERRSALSIRSSSEGTNINASRQSERTPNTSCQCGGGLPASCQPEGTVKKGRDRSFHSPSPEPNHLTEVRATYCCPPRL
jgi:hypothetical protein